MDVTTRIHGELTRCGIKLAASLPDDWVAPLIQRIAADNQIRHVRVAREAEAVAICSGAFFGGVRSVALMGATGLLTCTGELATLNLRHQIPVFLIVSQRGSIDDHRIYQEVQGRRTIPLLQSYDFPYHVVDRPEEVRRHPRRLRNLPAAEAAVRAVPDAAAGERRGAGMKARDAIDVLARHRGDAIAVCALGMAANEWWAATKSEDSFYMHGAMGFAASFALGLALSLPQVPVWLINADGSLCMNLGCLLTEASQAAPNLKHFVVDNGVYQTVGALPMVNDGRTDYAAIARAAGLCARARNPNHGRARAADARHRRPKRGHHSRCCASSPNPASCARRR